MDMKANELRIGNYYQYAGNYGIVTTRLKGIKINEFGFYSDLDDTNLGICKPIPLTEELLLKFGFKKSNNLNNRYEIEHIGVVMLNNNNCLYIYDYYNEVHVSLSLFKYVHQLQNLYFALTQTELKLNK